MKRVYHQLKNNSRVAVILLIAIIVPVPLHSQATRKGSLDYLQLCNGFKSLILGSDQKYMSDFKLAYLDDDDKADTDDCFSIIAKTKSINFKNEKYKF